MKARPLKRLNCQFDGLAGQAKNIGKPGTITFVFVSFTLFNNNTSMYIVEISTPYATLFNIQILFAIVLWAREALLVSCHLLGAYLILSLVSRNQHSGHCVIIPSERSWRFPQRNAHSRKAQKDWSWRKTLEPFGCASCSWHGEWRYKGIGIARECDGGVPYRWKMIFIDFLTI